MFINRKRGQEYGLFRYAVLYSELRGKLDELAILHAQNMRVEVIGKSNEGRDILLVILAENACKETLAAYEADRRRLVRHPEEAEKSLRDGREMKLPLMINCNEHGNEISGTDGMLDFIHDMLTTDLKKHLKTVTFFITICMNPDGRARGFDIMNGHGVDLNRDWMVQSQPETRALVEGVLGRFYPAIMVDMHGFMGGANILIDACTQPHNPFLEYDLLEGHMLGNARAMGKVITERLGVGVDIPAEIWESGWEDYSPIYTAVFFLCFGAICHTLETNYPSEEGAEATRCATHGMLDYVVPRAQELLLNQCTFFLRGVQGTPTKLTAPAFYRIPLEGQSDLELVSSTVENALRNGVRLFRDRAGAYVVPADQPLRPLVHNLFWRGEDISEQIAACYDISFYSFPVMRGLLVEDLDTFDDPLEEVSGRPGSFFPAVHTQPKQKTAFACTTAGAPILANALLKEGKAVYRDTRSGAFVAGENTPAALLEDVARHHHLKTVPLELNATLVPLSRPRILVVGDSGCLDELMESYGFESDFLLYSELNRGYHIQESRYDLLLAGGTEYWWKDVFDETLGCSYQVTWAMRDRARKELLRAAEGIRHRVLFGYAGDQINKSLGLLPCTATAVQPPLHTEGAEGAENWMLSVPNGSFTLQLDPEDPLCHGYGRQETFYLVAPMSYSSADARTPLRFAQKGSFQNGFNRRKGETDGQIAALWQQKQGQTDVLFGFDPSFRRYVDKSFPLLINAIWPAM